MNPTDDTTEPGPAPLVRSITTETLPAPLTLDGLIDQACDKHVAACLATSIATALDIGVLEAWNTMGELPADSLHLLHSPTGHARIANFVAVKLTGDVLAAPLMPTIN